VAQPQNPDPRATFGTNLRNARKRAALSQEALALDAGLHPTEINRLESGRRNPGLLTIVKVANALDVPTAVLVENL
jgi:transcriptional regulator with XRE-family HTH domain